MGRPPTAPGLASVYTPTQPPNSDQGVGGRGGVGRGDGIRESTEEVCTFKRLKEEPKRSLGWGEGRRKKDEDR